MREEAVVFTVLASPCWRGRLSSFPCERGSCGQGLLPPTNALLGPCESPPAPASLARVVTASPCHWSWVLRHPWLAPFTLPPPWSEVPFLKFSSGCASSFPPKP